MAEQPFLEKVKHYADLLDGAFSGERKMEMESFDHHGIEELEVSTDEAAVEVRTHEEEQIDVELKTYKNGPELEASQSEGTLKIIVRKARPLSLGYTPSVRLSIIIPNRLWNSISIHTQSGSIKVNDANISLFTVKSSSGDSEINHVYADEASLRTSSGEITINELKSRSLSFASSSGVVSLTDVNGDIYGKTHSGEITVEHCMGGELELKNKSGGIDAQKVTANRVSFRTTSGNIDANDLVAGESQLSSQSGEIRCLRLSGGVRADSTSGEVELDFTEPGENISVHSKSGDIELRQHGEGWNARVKANTESGDIEVRVPSSREWIEGETRHEGVLGDGKGTIELSSHSGDIAIG